MKKLFLLILISANFSIIFAQDTIFFENSKKYSSKDTILKSYDNSLEIIKFSEDFYKLEICYYIDNKRITLKNFTRIYKFRNDSLLFITQKNKEPEEWIYHKKNDTTYRVLQIKSGRVAISGKATKLVPITKHGRFSHYKNNGKVAYYQYYNENKYEKIETPKQELGEILVIAEEMPEFTGGEVALRKFIAENFTYPEISRNVNIQGTTYVRFVVTKTGEVANIEIVRSVDENLDKEAIRVISMLPDFKPGKQNGKPVNVYYTIPININLE